MRFVISIAVMIALSGCAPGPLLTVATKAITLGQDLPDYMVHVNLVGVVLVDEKPTHAYSRIPRSLLYLHGAAEGTPEYGYRAVTVELRFLKGEYRWSDAEYGYRTAAVVPDHLPLLKVGDRIEIRQTGTFDTLKNFSKTGEGNAILRMLCQKSSPDYEACVAKLPKTGKYLAQGYTGAPYLASLKDYGYKFTPVTSATGEQLREVQ